MLYLDPPYEVIDGYLLLPDHAEPQLFYVLPPAPTLAIDADGLPELSLVQYLGGVAGSTKIAGGLLTLAVELAIPEAVLLELATKLQARLGNERRGALQLQPVLFEKGTVELIALGQTSLRDEGDHAERANGEDAAWQLEIIGSGKPSLTGKNRAVFQLVLDERAAELVEKALEAPELPLIAIYRMHFTGLRPSYEIKIEADWSKVYQSLEKAIKANLYVLGTDVQQVIAKALEENDVRIDKTIFGSGEAARGAAERAQKQLLDWVLERMFQPVVAPPAKKEADSLSKVIDKAVGSLARALVPGVSFRLRKLDETQIRHLAIRMEEVVAESREVAPQGTLGSLLKPLQIDAAGQPRPEWAPLRERLIQRVNLDGFPRLEVKVGVEDRFASDGLATVKVELARFGEDEAERTDLKALLFTSAAEIQHYAVNLLGREWAGFATPYQYRTTVQFDPEGVFGPHPPLTSHWTSGNTTELYVEPRAVYQVRRITISTAPTFSFSQFPAVTVELEYQEDNETLQTSRLELKPEALQQQWRFCAYQPELLPYRYRVTYHRSVQDGGSIARDWQEATTEWLTISDPLPAKRTLNLFVNLPWEEVMVAFLQIRYHDPENDIHYEEQIDLQPDSRYLRRDYPIGDQRKKELTYRLTMLLQNGKLLEGSWRETREERLVIDGRLVAAKVVKVQLLGSSLAEQKLAEVRLQLEVRDLESEELRAATELSWQGEQVAPQVWEYLLGDPPLQQVTYSALFIDINGFTQRTPWQVTTADLLIINLRSRTVNG